MYPHRIRLAGPWELEIVGNPSEPGALATGACDPSLTLRALTGAEAPRSPNRVTIPCRLPGFTGTVRFTRRFGYPGRIDDYERVWLTFAGVAGRAAVCLNGTTLGRIDGPAEFEITRLLSERNQLQVDVEGAGGKCGLWGDVALEVRRTAFLRNVSVTDALRVSGEVVGTADGPLELYVIADRRTVAYATVQAGSPSEVAGSLVGLEDSTHPTRPQFIRVDLVQGASIWHRETIPIAPRAQSD
jgi:hypothetical protein